MLALVPVIEFKKIFQLMNCNTKQNVHLRLNYFKLNQIKKATIGKLNIHSIGSVIFKYHRSLGPKEVILKLKK